MEAGLFLLGKSLSIHALLDGKLAVLFNLNDALHALVSRHRDIDHVGSGVQKEFRWRILVENVLVNCDLCALRLGLH